MDKNLKSDLSGTAEFLCVRMSARTKSHKSVIKQVEKEEEWYGSWVTCQVKSSQSTRSDLDIRRYNKQRRTQGGGRSETSQL
ncbi:hypothetical protein SKAU_G00240220 [Synaphobranchus kaupii]|uniref:Uncharacterized protein n=1 Tax=Synaphobranchus kaupii TaxID=118154 RepID=A0A9Q1F7F2_SYNKA|nr:hypothetical protein SKAU_G00240220 [Synaphobranchus kaupii]